MDLVKFYEKMWALTGNTVNEEGFLRAPSSAKDGKTSPVLVDGKQIVLPTMTQLRMPDWNNRIVFHPLWEDIQKGESPLLGYYRSALQTALGMAFSQLFLDLMLTASDTPKHPTLNEEQLDFLRVFKRIDKVETMGTMFKMFSKILGAMNQVDRTFVKIYIKRLGLYKGESHKAVAVVSFPLYEELCRADTEKDKQVWGVDIAAKYRDTLKDIYEYIYPGIATAEKYNYGSLDDVAPKLNAVLMAFDNVASRIGVVADVFEGYVTLPNKDLLDTEVINIARNLRVMEKQRLSVPMQSGNETRPSESAVEAVVRSVVPTSEVNETVANVTSGFISPSGGLDLTALSGIQRPQMQQDPFGLQRPQPVIRQSDVMTSSGGINPMALMALDKTMRPTSLGSNNDFSLSGLARPTEAVMPWNSAPPGRYAF